MLNDALLFAGLILIGLKFGLGARLRELGRMLDGLVNILLVLIVTIYTLQLGYLFFFGRHH